MPVSETVAAFTRDRFRTLEDLQVFEIRVTDTLRYRFSPGTTEVAGDAAAWIAGYRRNPKAVVKLITVARPEAPDDILT